MGCPPVREDNPRALDYLTYRWQPMVKLLFYTTYISVDLAQPVLFRAKVGKHARIQILFSGGGGPGPTARQRF